MSGLIQTSSVQGIERNPLSTSLGAEQGLLLKMKIEVDKKQYAFLASREMKSEFSRPRLSGKLWAWTETPPWSTEEPRLAPGT